MFIENISKELLEEIQDALNEEHSEATSNWDGELIDLEYEDLDDMIRSQIFSDYLNIPLHMLSDMIKQHLPFLEKKNIFPEPFSEVIISEYSDKKEVNLRVFADVYNFNREILSETENRLLDKLLGELTQLYADLEVYTTIYITHIPIEDVPEEYVEEEDHKFVRIEFN